ncbi:MAG TPA: UDP-2,4-diacetamido-2,4,6-trideoxy-beta-L-altropyranose hydrolase [Candidatus Paceibacterota bacterium]|nr:UDP-2,4-diacetamido-2,4,6-trideoxy-beta-L-altropyranose hydrolase [Verrucomicrobiota bacterium]HSA09925.1 UDP-2,4-diacetamido-2,4,6-trideoxy-beta-L-altropyranose hydrolase [Candidatus Paceibacterota bacterium]
MTRETLLIRADASPQIGTGHVMRCLALAQVWQQAHGRVIFALAQPAGPIRERLEAGGLATVELPHPPGSPADAAVTVAMALQQQAAWTVVDGYHFQADYQRRLKDAGLRLVAVDDYGHAESYCADYVLNQSLGASAALYQRLEPHTRLLLGAQYVLLRQEFLKWRTWQRQFPQPARRVLVTLGGSDPANVTLSIITGIGELKQCEATVLVGSNNPHWQELQAGASAHAPRMKLLRNAVNMPELMAEADLAIVSGGTTAVETAFMGLPALLVLLADNQKGNVQRLEAIGAARRLSGEDIAGAARALLNDPVAREEMSRKGRALIDGEGSFRVWLHLMEPGIQLRPATEQDCRLVWEWANDPVARQVSFSTKPIPWEEHVRWFTNKLRQKEHCFWLACDRAGQAFGQVRFDTREGRTVISVNLGAQHRGRNLGSFVIWAACRKLFRETPAATVDAWIKADNAASVRAFQKAGFAQARATVVNQQPALVLTLPKDRAEL